MSEVFEVKRSKIFYEYNDCQCEDVGDVLSFKGVVTFSDGYTAMEDIVIGFFDYNSNSYYWFYEDFEGEFYLNKLERFDSCKSSLNELEEAINEDVDGTFKLTHVAHDYSLFIQKE